jgi:NADPH:quinone reductase
MTLRVEMERYGGPEELRPVERPDVLPPPGEVVVRTAVAGVNRADLFIRAGQWPQGGGWPYVPGLEACGRVERVGPDVSGLEVGDPVITMMQRLGGIHGLRAGGYQERVCVAAAALARVPEGLPLEMAGALGLPAVTAWMALRVLNVRPGQRVLVHAGSSAVGLMAVQILRHQRARVVATGTRAAKFGLVRGCGAEEVVDTSAPDWPRRVGPVDHVFDLVGRETFAASVGLLSPGGRLLFVGGTTGAELAFSGWDLMRPVVLTGYSSETLTRDEVRASLSALAALHARGALTVPQLTRFPLAQAADAHRALESGALAGRVVLTAG